MNICEQIRSELISEAIISKAGLGVAVKNFGARVKQLLVKHKLVVTNYDFDKMCKDLIKGKAPSTKIKWVELEKMFEGIELKGNDLFKGDNDIPQQFKNNFAKSFNAFASMIMSADDTLFSSVGRGEFLRPFLQIEVEQEGE